MRYRHSKRRIALQVRAVSSNTAWCGRGDDGMIFNSNDLEVAPPNTLAFGEVRTKMPR